MNLIARLFCALLLAAVFAGAMLALIAGVFAVFEQVSGHRMIPRGAGWGFAIIAALIGGLRTGYRLPDNMDLVEIFWLSFIESKIGRAILVLMVIWIAGWTTYAWNNLEGYDQSCYENCGGWGATEWTYYLEVLFSGPFALLISSLVFRWVKSGK